MQRRSGPRMQQSEIYNYMATAKKKKKDILPGGAPTKYDPVLTIAATRKYIDASVDTYEAQVVEMPPSAIDLEEDENALPRTTMGPVEFKVKLPTLEGLAATLKIHKDTIQEWKKLYPEFSVLVVELLSKQGEALIRNGLNGKYNSTIAKLILTKHGYVDKQVIDDKRSMLGDVFDAAAKRRKELEDAE